MPSPLQAAGVDFQAPKFAPLHVNRWWTGLWTNRNLLREGAVPYIYEKYYAANRFESILAGNNVEISPRLTPTRRFGNSVYNSQTFPAIDNFYSFRVFDPLTADESIRVIVDTVATVYDGTGPSTKLSIFNKSAGAGETTFQSLGNTLYMADGIDQKKLIGGVPQWQSVHSYKAGDRVVDSNGNIQEFVGGLLDLGFGILTVTFVQIASNAAIVDYTPFSTQLLAQGLIGQNVTFTGVGTATFLNNNTYQVTGVNGSNFAIQFSIVHADYVLTADTGTMYFSGATNTSGGSAPAWSTTIGGLTIDGNVAWRMKSPQVLDWQPVGPATAPVVSNIINTTTFPNWVAATFYNPSLQIVDSNGNIQLLTTGGQTGGGAPVWNLAVGGTTADNTAVWTNQGTATRATSHAYAVGAVIQVTFSIIKTIKIKDPDGGFDYRDIVFGPYTDNFVCTVAGTSSATATSSIAWTNGINTTVVDGSVTWKNTGSGITWLTIGAATLVSLNTQIEDDNGNLETVLRPGKSSGAHPTWATAVGGTTADGADLVWSNIGPATAANTGAWVYGYGFKVSLTGSISVSSPKSVPIILAASSLISVSGQGDPNWATDGVDTIQIYRSVQGFTTLFLLAEIPAPANGGPWSYVDGSPDPPDPASTLNEFIKADVDDINEPPPQGITALAYYLSRMWGVVGSVVYYSSSPQQSIGVNTDNWPGSNFFQLPSTVIRLFPTTTGIIFFTNHGLYLSSGIDSLGNPNQPVPFLEDIGILSYNCFTVNGSNPIIFTRDQQFVALDPGSGVTRVGFPIEDLLASFSPTACYVTWHTKGPDQAAYISDGSTGWFRVNLTPAPETGGYTWSPFATIVGGVKCVLSIEVSPGVQELLLGPVTSGPILKRDPNTNQDNGSNYPADFTVGNIVMAQPGQSAGVDFIVTEAKRIGSDVSLAILADEISGAFETFPDNTTDPPGVTPSTTVFATRWYFSGLTTPSWMRHMQLKFTWPSENAANELLTLTPSAALYDNSGR